MWSRQEKKERGQDKAKERGQETAEGGAEERQPEANSFSDRPPTM